MKNIEKRIKALEEKAGLVERLSHPTDGDLQQCFDAFCDMLSAYGQHDSRAREHQIDEDGSIRFAWSVSQKKWNAFYYAWDLQRRNYEKQIAALPMLKI